MATVGEVLSAAQKMLNADDPRATSILVQVLSQYPDQADALFLFGYALLEKHLNPDRARRFFAAAVAVDPLNESALSFMADRLVRSCQVAKAESLLRPVTRANPDNDAAQASRLFILNYLPGWDDARLTAENARYEIRRAVPGPTVQATPSPAGPPHNGRRLRVGYVSDEFDLHVLYNSIAPVLAAHDRTQFEITGFFERRADHHSVANGAARVVELRTAMDHWVDLGDKGEAEKAAAVEATHQDILICLSGWSAKSRSLFRRRLAPVQIAYVNYVGPMGMPHLDYRISDPVLDPEGVAPIPLGETPIRLACGHQFWGPPSEVPPLNRPPSECAGHITFGSFNNLAKLQPETLAVYARALRAVPTARLLIKAKDLDNSFAQDRIRETFRSHGIDPARLDLVGYVADPAENDRLKMAVDLALDSFPFTGGQTSVDTLMCGIPMITLTGPSYIHRGGASILARIGLNDLVAESPHDFVRLAATLANDPDCLAVMRADMRPRIARSNLSDAPLHTQHLEAALHWAARQSPGRPASPADGSTTIDLGSDRQG